MAHQPILLGGDTIEPDDMTIEPRHALLARCKGRNPARAARV
jgi:hypothetical protein